MIRYLTAMTSSAGVTLALLYVMQMLIDLSVEEPPQSVDRRSSVAWVPPQVVEPSAIPPAPSHTLKRIPGIPAQKPTTTDLPVFKYPKFTDNESPRPETPTFTLLPISNDGPLVAILRVEPPYPIRAAEQGLEGYVVVEFDVAPNGTVQNVKVISSSHRLFEAAAVKAAQRFRYKARVVDGEPQPSLAIRNRFTFEMDRG